MSGTVPPVQLSAQPGRAAQSRGVLFVHSSPKALCSHIEWALTEVLRQEVRLEWIDQPALAGTVRTEFSWAGEVGEGSRIASALRAFPHIRYEVTEEPSVGREGERYAVTPELGLFRATIGIHGDILVSEDRLRSAVAASAGNANTLTAELDRLLGTQWDEELEVFRYAGAGTPVRWLHQVV